MQIVSGRPRLLSILPISFGILWNLWADRIFKRLDTTVLPHAAPAALVTTGPYRLSRHPMYLGMTALLLGEAVALGSLSAFLPALAFALIIQTAYIPLEDNNLTNAFGDDYLLYKKNTRPWL